MLPSDFVNFTNGTITVKIFNKGTVVKTFSTDTTLSYPGAKILEDIFNTINAKLLYLEYGAMTYPVLNPKTETWAVGNSAQGYYLLIIKIINMLNKGGIFHCGLGDDLFSVDLSYEAHPNVPKDEPICFTNTSTKQEQQVFRKDF